VRQRLFLTYRDVAPAASADHALLMAYGENNLGLRNIPLAGGSVTVRGSAVPPGH
jgi:hypothetical protein